MALSAPREAAPDFNHASMSHPSFELTRHLPRDYEALLWQVFFVERGRGLGLDVHFPWLRDETCDAWYVCLRDDGDLICGLTVKPLPQHHRMAAVGLVCVQESHRGSGWGGRLLRLSMQALDDLGFDGLTLWTGKPAVYESLGFAIEDEGRFGTVQWWSAACAAECSAKVARWPDRTEAESSRRGLPAFAGYAQRLSRSDASAEVVVLHDPQGVALAEWRGHDAEVAQLLAAVMPPHWRLNALQQDSLPTVLAAAGAIVDLADSRLQMWRDRPGLTGSGRAVRPMLRLLDRI
jgi:hypothetical protein